MSMQAALKEFLILPPTPENKALFLSQWPLASLFGAITETGDKLNDLIVPPQPLNPKPLITMKPEPLRNL